MLEKAEEMENDPTCNKNNIEPPPEEEEQNNVEEDETELELDEYSDAFFEDGSFDESLPFATNALNRQLDMLQSALDEIESRNAGIHKELLEILHSNREVRRTMQEENSSSVASSAATASETELSSCSRIITAISTDEDGVPEEKGAAEQAKTKGGVERDTVNKGQGQSSSSKNSVGDVDAAGDNRNERLKAKADNLLCNTTAVATMLHSVTQDIEKL